MSDVLDVLTSAEAISALTGPGSPDTTKLAMLTTAVSNALDEVCGPIVTRSVSRTFFAPTGPLWLDVPAGSTTFTVSSLAVTEYSGGVATVLAAETATVSTGSDYRYDAALGRVSRRSGWTNAAWAPQEVLVVYMAGRYASTATVGAKFKQAAKITLKHLWQIEQGFAGFGEEVVVTGTGFAIPQRALHVIGRSELLLPAVA